MRVNTRVILAEFYLFLFAVHTAFQNFGKIFGINAVICLAASFAVITVFMYFAAPKNDVVLISAGSVLRPGLFMLVCGAAAVLGFMAQMLADANLRWLAFFVFICALAAPVIGFIFYKREIEKPEIISADSVIHAESQRVYSVKEMVISAVSIMLSLLF